MSWPVCLALVCMRASVRMHLCFHCYSKKCKKRDFILYLVTSLGRKYRNIGKYLPVIVKKDFDILCHDHHKYQNSVPFCVYLVLKPQQTEPLMSLWIHEASDGCSLAASVLCVWWKRNQHQRAYIDFFISFLLNFFFVFTSNDYQTHYDFPFLM